MPRALTNIALQGMEWILRMYSEGSCPDYRWTYDSFAPQASQVLAELSPKKAPAQEDEAASASEAPGDLVLPPPRLVRTCIRFNCSPLLYKGESST